MIHTHIWFFTQQDKQILAMSEALHDIIEHRLQVVSEDSTEPAETQKVTLNMSCMNEKCKQMTRT